MAHQPRRVLDDLRRQLQSEQHRLRHLRADDIMPVEMDAVRTALEGRRLADVMQQRAPGKRAQFRRRRPATRVPPEGGGARRYRHPCFCRQQAPPKATSTQAIAYGRKFAAECRQECIQCRISFFAIPIE